MDNDTLNANAASDYNSNMTGGPVADPAYEAREKLALLQTEWLHTVLNKYHTGEKPAGYDEAYANAEQYK